MAAVYRVGVLAMEEHCGGENAYELLEEAKGDIIVDLEDLIYYAVKEFTLREAKTADRMKGIFLTMGCNRDGSIPLHEFGIMSQRLVKEGVDGMAPRSLLRLFSALCARPGILNAQAFHRLAVEFSLAEFRPGPLRGETLLTSEQEESLDSLELVAQAANQIMQSTFRREDDVNCRDLAARWDMMKGLIVKRRRPELAWTIFNATTKAYSEIKKKETRAEAREEARASGGVVPDEDPSASWFLEFSEAPSPDRAAPASCGHGTCGVEEGAVGARCIDAVPLCRARRACWEPPYLHDADFSRGGQAQNADATEIVHRGVARYLNLSRSEERILITTDRRQLALRGTAARVTHRKGQDRSW
eukprot:CAMPEP_0180248840 /NCGR_PEP_ID=MMETSP0987-20121128/36953_1 /TAXON_ID=697907 /ORGANISM="non described non described, Strain CCMP2293" /LENGTH=358 /DNA_ID=CAMNT_0022217011 /DNA_START=19 /DNA_END=1093 /DNA_ORIENTATION=-